MGVKKGQTKSQEKKFKQKVRKISMWWKLLVPVNVVLLAVCSLLSGFAYLAIDNQMMTMGRTQAETVAHLAEANLNPTMIAQLKEPGMEDTEMYKDQQQVLFNVREKGHVLYIYTLFTDGKKVYYGVDADTSETACAIGEEFELSYEELEKVFQGEEYIEEDMDNSDGEKLITAYVPIRSASGVVVGVVGCDLDASGILEELESVSRTTILLTVVGLAVSMAVVLLTVNNIMKNLNQVNAKLYDLANNEGDLTQKLDIKSGDEVELIGNNINSVLEYIRGIMLNIAGNSTHLNNSSQMVVSNLTAAQESITDVSATMQQMSAGMEETSAALTEINDSVVDISEEIDTINKRAEDGKTSSDDIMTKAAAVYQNAIAEQEEARHLANEMSATVNDKIEKSKAVETISALTDNIISITNQTNLLSLNASIEAARAGEAGRGFSVVADEISKLAANSAQAATQIQEVSKSVIDAVNDLAAEAEKMIQFMDETAMTGYEKLLTTSKDYQNDVGDMNQMMTEFAMSSQNLKLNVESIKESVNAVNIAIEESAKGITSVSEATVNITSSVDDIGLEANSNLDIASGLESEVNRFKLN